MRNFTTLKVILLLLCLKSTAYSSTFIDSFDQQDRQLDQRWIGDREDFKINDSGELQLDAKSSGTSKLWVPIELEADPTWQFWFQLKFSPSSSNTMKILLWALDTSDIESEKIWLEVGETGSPDSIRVYFSDSTIVKQIGTFPTPCSGSECAGKVILSFRSDSLFLFYGNDKSRPVMTYSIFKGLSRSKGTVGFFGLHLNYTQTRKSNFFFDNILIAGHKRIFPRITIKELQLTSAASLRLIFSNPVHIDSGRIHSYISITPPHTTVSSLVWNKSNAIQLDFYLSDSLSPGIDYSIKIRNIQSPFGDTIQEFDTTLFHFPILSPYPNSIVINEIYSDPDESSPLPQAEFIELFNISNYHLSLDGLELRDRTGSTNLSTSFILPPNTFVILCHLNKKSLFADVNNLIPMASFPTLNNDEEVLKILSPAGKLLDESAYDLSFFDEEKQNGGWTLERVDPFRSCQDQQNWKASISNTQGTPGDVNSVFDTLPSNEKIWIERGDILDNYTILCHLNLPISELNASVDSTIFIYPNIEIEGIFHHGTEGRAIEIWLKDSLEQNVFYSVIPGPYLKTCMGSSTSSDSIMIALPGKPEPGDLLFSEVLYDPEPDGSEFIEIYNASLKVILSDQIKISVTGISGTSKSNYLPPQQYILPETYYCLTEDKFWLEATYPLLNKNAIFNGVLPSLSNQGANIQMWFALDSTLLDEMTYSPDQHDPLLNHSQGISLEKISHSIPSRDSKNWYSASTLQGGASPGMPNTQEIKHPLVDTLIDVYPISNTFSPDEDGYEDQYIIAYSFQEPGTSALLRIFDLSGNLVYNWSTPETLGTEGIISWDGRDNLGIPSKIGLYIVQLELLLTSKLIQKERWGAILTYPLNTQ